MKVSLPTAFILVVCLAAGAATILSIRGDGTLTESLPVSEIQTVVKQHEVTVVKPQVLVKKIEKLEIDINQLRVYIPSDGWLSAAEFWDIYYNKPQKLPGEIDFELLQQLENLTEADRALAERNSDLGQLPVDSDGDALIDTDGDTLDPV